MSTRVPAKRVVWSTRASARALIVTADFLITATALPPYTHIGMEDRAEALATIPDQFISKYDASLRIVCISGGAGRQHASRADGGDDDDGGGGNEQNPVVPGFASPRVTNYYQLTACGKMEAAGIAPAAPSYPIPVAKSTERPGSEIGRYRETLMLDRVETVIWRAIHAVAGCARDTGPCPVIELTSSGASGGHSPTRGGQVVRRHRPALVGMGAVNQICGFFTRGSVIGGESCVLRR